MLLNVFMYQINVIFVIKSINQGSNQKSFFSSTIFAISDLFLRLNNLTV